MTKSVVISHQANHGHKWSNSRLDNCEWA